MIELSNLRLLHSFLMVVGNFRNEFRFLSCEQYRRCYRCSVVAPLSTVISAWYSVYFIVDLSFSFFPATRLSEKTV